MSMLVFSQTFGGAIFLSLEQLVFNQGLISGLQKYAPDINAEVVINAGATAVRSVVSPANLPSVLRAYMVGIDRVFYLGTGASGGVFLFAWGMGWKSIKAKSDIVPTKTSATDLAVKPETT